MYKAGKHEIMFEIKFIKNPVTVQNLKALYESAEYQDLLVQFDRISRHILDKRQEESGELIDELSTIQRRYLILNIPFDEVLSEFEKQHSVLLRFTVLSIAFFSDHDDCPDGEFPEGEEPDEADKSQTIETFGVARTFLLDKFCELYLLNLGDKERLLHYLKTTRMPGTKKYASQIAKLYEQAVAADYRQLEQ